MKLKGKKMEKQNNYIERNAPASEFSVIIAPNGRQVEFIDNRHNPNAISGEPNITRIVFGQPYREGGQIIATDGQVFNGLPEQTNKGIQPLYHAKVSWYNENDAVMFDHDGVETGRRAAYSPVVLGVDLARINSKDMNYCRTLFLGLLDRSRVSQYLHTGLLEDPMDPEDKMSKKTKCGNYVGHVAPAKFGEFTKYFNGRIGEMVHDSPEMVAKRKDYYEALLKHLVDADREDERKIMELQKERSKREPQIKKISGILDRLKGDEEIER